MTPCSRIAFAVAFAILCAAPVTSAQAQSDPSADIHELVLRDGSRVFGTIERETADDVVLRTASGVIVSARKSQVLSLKRVNGRIVAGEFQRADPTGTRLFFAPTGRQLKRGEAYFGVYQILLPTLQVGVTDRISVGGGTPLLFFGDGDDGWDRPFWVTPKVQLVDTGTVQAAAGIFHGFNTNGDGAGIGYGVVTAGSPRGAITGGAGLAYSGDGGRSFVVMVGADRQLSRSVKVITENYLWKNGHGIVSVGFRFFGEQLSADVGLASPIGEPFLLPVVNFVYSF